MSVFGPMGLSLAQQVTKSRTLYRWFKPVANWYAHIAGYRQMGLKYDDLREFPCVTSFDKKPTSFTVLEEREDVQKVYPWLFYH